MFFLSLCYAVVCRIRLRRKDAEYNNICIKYNDLQLKYAVSESKFADIVSNAQKAESEKQSLQNVVTGLERDLGAQKAAAEAREEALTEKISYLEKIKEDLTLKYKDSSNEIIKTKHECFLPNRKTHFRLYYHRLPNS